MDFKQLSYDELIDYCKTNQINYQTKTKKNNSDEVFYELEFFADCFFIKRIKTQLQCTNNKKVNWNMLAEIKNLTQSLERKIKIVNFLDLLNSKEKIAET